MTNDDSKDPEIEYKDLEIWTQDQQAADIVYLDISREVYDVFSSFVASRSDKHYPETEALMPHVAASQAHEALLEAKVNLKKADVKNECTGSLYMVEFLEQMAENNILLPLLERCAERDFSNPRLTNEERISRANERRESMLRLFSTGGKVSV